MTSPRRSRTFRPHRLSFTIAAALAITVASVAAAQEDSQRPQRDAAAKEQTRDVPGFLLDNGRYITIDAPRRLWETVPQGIGPIGLNDHEQIVGSYIDDRGVAHGFLLDRRRGRFIDIDVPGAPATQAEDINNGGQIVGKYARPGQDLGSTTLRGFLLDRGRFIRLDFPGAQQTIAHGINARGQVVGEYTDRAGRIHGFFWTRGRFTAIDGPARGNETTALNRINDRGQMLGIFGPPDVRARGFVSSSGMSTPFAFPGARFTIAYGLNNRGQIVGVATNQNPNLPTEVQAFILAKGIGGPFTPLDRPGRSITVPFDINNRSQIVGVAINTPAPSEATAP
jgi:probable HAF family extracellular repeat protein